MSDGSKIEWTDSTWNPVTGCDKVSPGCDHCYAETIAHRFDGTKAYPNGFRVTLRPERLDQPLRWKRPRRVFANSMSDLFHKDVPDEYIARVWAVMALAPQHTFQILTKRHGRMRSLLSSTGFRGAVEDAMTGGVAAHGPERVWYDEWPLPNVWLGVSVEDQQRADLRIPALLDTPAAVRFLSCEPLLGPVDLARWTRPHTRECLNEVMSPPWCVCRRDADGYLDWVIVGGESGPGARPMHADWARSLRDECAAGGVPFLFKQWGEWAPTTRLGAGEVDDPRECFGEVVDDGKYPLVTWRRVYRRVGKKAAGRLLDGREHNGYPRGGGVVSDLVDPAEIERIVGVRRHRSVHFGRAVSSEQSVYILHSHKCRDSGIDLRECRFSLALDLGIEPRRWEAKEDRPVLLGIWEGRLVPTKDMSDGTLVSLR